MITRLANKKIIEDHISNLIFTNIEFTIDELIKKTKIFCEQRNFEFVAEEVEAYIVETINILADRNLIECKNDTYYVMYETYANSRPAPIKTCEYVINDHYYF